jgi:hypothetical protein
MKSERLIFPMGVRLATDAYDELPLPKLTEEDLERTKRADIRTDYTIKKNVEKPGFTSFVEANVHVSDIWRVFTGLVNRLLTAKAVSILVYDRGHPRHGPLASTASILEVASEFNDAIANDCFIAFGIMANPEEKLRKDS